MKNQVMLLSDSLDVRGLLAFRTLGHIEGDFLAFFQGFEAAHRNRGEVSEQIFATIFRSDEAEALGVVKPLDGTVCHNKKRLSNFDQSHEP